MTDLHGRGVGTRWTAALAMLMAATGGCAEREPQPAAAPSQSSSTASAEPSERKKAKSAEQARPTAAQRCSEPRLSRAARELQITASDGTRLFGVELGSGPRGLVLLHTSSSTGLCGWSPAMLWLADAGYHVLAIDSRCAGYSQCKSDALDLDALAATDWLRDHGAETVIAVGGSQGSSVALATAAHPHPGLDAVVALSGGSPQEYYTGPDAAKDPVALARRIHVPVLYVSALDDEGVPQRDYRALYRATPSHGTDYIALEGSGHAIHCSGTSSAHGSSRPTSWTSSQLTRPNERCA